MKKKVYVAGKVSGLDRDKTRDKFGYMASRLREQGYAVINPFAMLEDTRYDLDREAEMTICFAAITVCDAVYMLEDWSESPGARAEHEFAINKGKEIIYQTAERMRANA